MSAPHAALTQASENGDQLRRLQARIDREKRARAEAERLLETRARELYDANRALAALAADLERRVEERTRELSDERQCALLRAEIDPLTGIANRAAFSRRLDEQLADPRARADGLGALLIDVDDFKAVNDKLGHAAGDTLLIETARRLLDTVRPGDMVARLGGDEFAVLARNVRSPDGAHALAQRLLRALCEPVMIDGDAVACRCSIGVAQPDHHDDGDALLRSADLALYASKRNGRARVTMFDAALRAALQRRASEDNEVRAAVQRDQILPWYQPILHRSSGRFVGAEVLARWHCPGGEVRPPGAFLDAVERLGLLDTMMENMLLRALPEARAAIEGGTLDYLSVNVSPTQFNDGWAQKRLPALLKETGFPATALVVELTENAFVQDMPSTRAILGALTASGMRIAVDDFGVGYSNFSLLRQLPFHILKLDRTLVSDIESDPRSRALAECVLELAAKLKIKVVAEGVETSNQAALLAAAGCAGMQGYWFARPQRELSTWFASDAPRPQVPWEARTTCAGLLSPETSPA
jgi:diguanylate cyclase (GGDEF)-like protein